MTDMDIIPFAGDVQDREARSSAPILTAIKKAQKYFRDWQSCCDDIDSIYSLDERLSSGMILSGDPGSWNDSKLDLFWSSFEVMKPAIYARAPVPAVAPRFADNREVENATAELLERAATVVIAQSGLTEAMPDVRDDLLFAGRGVLWLRYENDEGQRVCVEHLDRTDFVHEPGRKWCEVGWVARRAWMTEDEMRERFRSTSGDAYADAKFETRRDDEHGDDEQSLTRKAGVWEVWHRADNRVYWVTEGSPVYLDDDLPHLDVDGFFPCPRPAFGTLRRRALVPVPDWHRYAVHFRKISDLTARIYLLLDMVRMKGLIPAGGDVGTAIEELVRSNDDELLIPVPGAALLSSGGAGSFVAWLPLNEVAQAIQGLIEARQQLIEDFYQLSGISDIMRGATEAQETLGAQQLKSQYGSVRVRCKIDELQRVAADSIRIAAEIIADKFTPETLLKMTRMEIPKKSAITKRIKDIEAAADQELKALSAKAKEAIEKQRQMPPNAQDQNAQPPAQQPDPNQAQQAFQQAQQQIVQKYAPMLQAAEKQVPLEEIMTLLRDDKVRSFTFNIADDSTIMADEMSEKQQRNEFLGQFNTASQSLMSMASLGDQGAELAGQMLKFALAPYRAGRQLDGAIDAFIDAAPQIASMAAKAGGQQDDNEALAKANQTLADAEMVKARAATAQVQAKAALDQAENQRKFAEMQQKAATDAQKAQAENDKLQLQVAQLQQSGEKQTAEIDNLTAQTAKILASIGLDERRQQLSEYSAANQAQDRQVSQAMAAQNASVDHQLRAKEQQRADRGEDRADRQQDFNQQQGASDE